MNPWLGILVILAATRALVGAVGVLERRWRLWPETARKSLHAAMGLLLATCPLLFSRAWPVCLLCVIYLALLAARPHFDFLHRPVARLMYGVGRRSLGDWCFPIAVTVLFLLSGANRLLFCVPLLILALADAGAAVIGCRYGANFYRGPGGRKSLEGSAAFFVIAFLVAHLALLLLTDLPRSSTLLAPLAVAAALTLAEGFCPLGSDNLVIPLSGFFLLRWLIF